MAEIVNFLNKESIGFINGIPVKDPKTPIDYLFLCKRFLTSEDYEEVLLSIMDEEYYDRADIQIRAIVDTYHNYKK